MSDWGRLDGLIPILGGIYGLLLAQGVLPRNPKDPERMALWRRKFGGMMTVLAPLLILFGVAKLLGALEARARRRSAFGAGDGARSRRIR